MGALVRACVVVLYWAEHCAPRRDIVARLLSLYLHHTSPVRAPPSRIDLPGARADSSGGTRGGRAPALVHADARHLLGEAQEVYAIDLENDDAAAAEGFGDASFAFEGVNPATISAFLGYFDVDFACGARLSTAPGAPDTHWGQTAFYCADLEPSSSTAGRLSFAQMPGEYFLAAVELDEADGVDVDVEELEVDLDDDDDDDEDALDYDDDDFDDDDDLDDDLDDADLVGLDELRWYLSNYD